ASLPSAPAGPVSPFSPLSPLGPCAPSFPSAPVSPLSPLGPCAPSLPAGPCGPSTPSISSEKSSPVGFSPVATSAFYSAFVATMHLLLYSIMESFPISASPIGELLGCFFPFVSTVKIYIQVIHNRRFVIFRSTISELLHGV